MPSHSRLRVHRCFYCGASKPTPQGLKSHISQSLACKIEFKRRTASNVIRNNVADGMSSVPLASELEDFPEMSRVEDQSRSSVDMDFQMYTEDLERSPDTPMSRRASMEEIDEEEAGGLPKQPYVDLAAADEVRTYGRGQTAFEAIDERQGRRARAQGTAHNPWAPFANDEEWGLSKWLLSSGLSQKAIDRYLKLKYVSR